MSIPQFQAHWPSEGLRLGGHSGHRRSSFFLEQGEDEMPFGGSANEPHLIFINLPGKLLIWARNESVELDKLMNIHLRLEHGVDQG